MNIWRKTLLALGISMLIAIVVGFLTSETKYFYLEPGKVKTEITKDNYENWASDYYAEFTSKENVYNIQSAIISGLVALSVLIIVISLVNKSSSKTE